MSHQKVRNVMSTDVAAALEGTSFKDVARILATWDVSALPVVDQERRVLGVVSEADLLVKQGKQEFEPRALLSRWRERRDRRRATATTAAQLMTRPAVTVDAGSTVSTAARLLTKHHVKRLPVVDEDGKLVGIVSRKDLLTVFLVDGVVDVTVSMTYRHDDTRDRLRDPMTSTSLNRHPSGRER